MRKLAQFALTLAGLLPAAAGAEISVLSAGAVKAPLAVLVERPRPQAGEPVTIRYAAVGVLQQQIAAGEVADLVIVSAEAMDELVRQGKVDPASRRALGAVGIGVAVREGAPVPDIATPEALKQTLLAAKSLVYVDPTKGTSGKHFAGVLQRLAIADAVAAKTLLLDGGYVVDRVSRGEIEIGVTQISEILPVKGVTLVGPLPRELQKITTYTGAVMTGARSPQAAKAFLDYLAGPEARPVFDAKGFAEAR